MRKNVYTICSLLISLIAVSVVIFFFSRMQKEGMTGGIKPTTAYTKLTDYTYADVQYHDDVETISKQPEIYGLPSGTLFETGKDGKKYATLVDNKFTFYKPDSRTEFGPYQYVPTYEDSIYLSKRHNLDLRNYANT